MVIMSPFTRSQSIVLILLRPISAVLSIVGSSIIIWKVVHGMEPRNRTPKHRILVAMSIYDILHTSWSAFGTVPLDKDRTSVVGAMGNRTTCEAYGFFLQLSQVIPLYNAFLAFYYMLRISYKLADTTIEKYYLEPLVHVVIGVFGWSFSIAGLVLDLYNPIVVPELGCWVATYPAFCNLIPDLECERGDGYELYVWVFSYNVLIVSFLIVVATNIRIFWTVFVVERRLARHAGTLPSPPATQHTTTSSRTSMARQRSASLSWRQEDPYRQSRAVAWINGGYTVAFLATFLWPVWAFLASILAPENQRLLYALTVLLQIFYPLQGFWNCLVFLQQPTWFWDLARNTTMRSFCCAPSCPRSTSDDGVVGHTMQPIPDGTEEDGAT